MEENNVNYSGTGDITKRKTKKPIIETNIFEHGRIPPHATDLEEAVLGAMLLESNALTNVIDILKPDVFYSSKHQKIFEAVFSLFSKTEPVDILTVTNELRKMGELENCGGAYYITSLTNRVASAANIEFHTRIVLQKFIQRELIRISTETIKDAYESGADVFDLLDKAEKNLFAVSESNLRRGYDNMTSLVHQAIKQIELAKGQEGHISGVPSGFTELDRVTAGWQKSDLLILAARPGMGKTAFVLSMARNIVVDFKRAVAVFSLEMSAIQLVTRLIASETKLPADKLKRGNLEPFEWEVLSNRVSQLADAPLFIDDTPSLSIFELRAKCRRLKAQHDIQLIVIDYLQLMSAGGDKSGNREQEISTISRSLKALAKELSVPVIALSQLSRAVETRHGNSKRPQLSDLRESGAIEQDADMVMFIYRPEYYKLEQFEDGAPCQGLAEIMIAKHRNGGLKDVRLKFIDKFARFEDMEFSNFSDSDFNMPNSNTFDALPVNNAGPKIFQSKMNDMPDEPPF